MGSPFQSAGTELHKLLLLWSGPLAPSLLLLEEDYDVNNQSTASLHMLVPSLCAWGGGAVRKNHI